MIFKTGNGIILTGNGIILTGNGIIYPISRPLIPKLLLQHLLHINQGVQNCFSKQEMDLSKQEIELFLPLIGLWPKNLFYNIFSILTKEFKTGNRIIQTGNGIIYPISRPLIKKLLLQNVFQLCQGVWNWISKQEIELSKQEMELCIPFPGL